jgi:Fe-S-cluster containining protein
MKAFQCKMCGACCYGKGGIRVKGDEIERISGLLGITPRSFKKDFCEERNGHLSIRTGSDGFCRFYREEGCAIHPVKPEICSLWPFYPAIVNDRDNWEMAKGACPGISPDSTFEEFVKESKE